MSSVGSSNPSVSGRPNPTVKLAGQCQRLTRTHKRSKAYKHKYVFKLAITLALGCAEPDASASAAR